MSNGEESGDDTEEIDEETDATLEKRTPNKLPSSDDQHMTGCRICFEDDAKEPFISPCKCTGSVQYIHFSCLKSWISSKRVMRLSPASVCYIWRNHECELCKTQLPIQLTKDLTLADYDVPENNYMVLETLSEDTNKQFIVVNLDA